MVVPKYSPNIEGLYFAITTTKINRKEVNMMNIETFVSPHKLNKYLYATINTMIYNPSLKPSTKGLKKYSLMDPLKTFLTKTIIII